MDNLTISEKLPLIDELKEEQKEEEPQSTFTSCKDFLLKIINGAKCRASYDDYGRRGEVDASGIVAIVVAVGVVTLAVSAINKATDHLLES
jgi:hypothetical protein